MNDRVSVNAAESAQKVVSEYN